MDTGAAARAWAEAWTRAWRALDPELLEPVYAPGAVQHSHPFREAGSPMEYVRAAFAEEEGEPEVWMADPIVTGDRAAIEWWACLFENGKQISLAGTSIVRFDEDGLALKQTDYWGQADGRVPPFEGWGQTPPGSDPSTAGQ